MVHNTILSSACQQAFISSRHQYQTDEKEATQSYQEHKQHKKDSNITIEVCNIKELMSKMHVYFIPDKRVMK